MPDRVEQFLDGLESRGTAGEPPPAFLRAVATRRRRRRMGQVGVLAGALLLAAGAWVGMQAMSPQRPIPEPQVARVAPPAISLVALYRANREMDVDALELPPAEGGWDAGSRPLRGGDPGEVEAWLSR